LPDEPTAITIDVLIAHPEPVQRTIIRHLLDGQPNIRVVAVIGDGSETAVTAELLRPAVILVDDRMTTPGGIEALARRSRVIVLTGETEPQVVAALLHEPARGYLIYDNFEPADLLGAVHAVAQGLAWLSPLAASAAADQMRSTSTSSTPARPRPDHTVRLTPRERQVLELLCQGLSNPDIAAALGLREKTIRNHLSRGFAKLGVTGRAEAVRRLSESPF
jgi:DNA-binding NarL/FixJ family response regulator